MKRKVTYEIRGQIERSCYFRVGKALLRVDFTGGSINSAGMTPANYVTDNPLYQKAIEESEQFRNGEIVIGATEKIEEKVAEANAASAEANSKKEVIVSVTNVQQARSILMGEPYKIPLSELQNKVAIRAKADELGISFPNWL
ncbi:MAG: hypothetical protein IKU50_05870 [Bacteroidaceae bacterium]|nr:hypothetical protein [Bacteroidaceae bacterium]MBR5511718.1 hypothetical protein [Bacteroidaceae bacterium]